MNEKIIKKVNNIKVTFFDTNKFKSICGILCFKTKVDRKKMTTRSLLRNILLHSCNKYPTNALLNKNCIENYDTYYSSFSRRDGEYYSNVFLFRTLDERYTDENNLNNVLDTFHEIIFNPNAKDNKFDIDEYNLAYNDIKTMLKTEKERARDYATKKLEEQMGSGTAIEYCPSLDILDSLTNEDLYKDYLDMINNSEITMFIAGHDVSKIDLSNFLKDLKTKTIKECIDIKTPINTKINSIIEEYHGMQSILTVGLKLGDLTRYEKSFVLPVFNNILGGGTSSRLFNEVREKNSLCYFCFSRYEKDDNLIQILSGIEHQNYEKALEIIKNVVDSMKCVDEKEVQTSINDIVSYLTETEDNLNNYVIPSYLQSLYEEVTIKEKIDIIKNVTKEDVEKLFNKIFITDSFFLKGGASNE